MGRSPYDPDLDHTEDEGYVWLLDHSPLVEWNAVYLGEATLALYDSLDTNEHAGIWLDGHYQDFGHVRTPFDSRTLSLAAPMWRTWDSTSGMQLPPLEPAETHQVLAPRCTCDALSDHLSYAQIRHTSLQS